MKIKQYVPQSSSLGERFTSRASAGESCKTYLSKTRYHNSVSGSHHSALGYRHTETLTQWTYCFCGTPSCISSGDKDLPGWREVLVLRDSPAL